MKPDKIGKLANHYIGNNRNSQRGWKTECKQMGKKPGNLVEFRELK